LRIGDSILRLKRDRWIAWAIAIFTIGACGAIPATAAAPAPPINDNYINSLEFNKPGHKLNGTGTLTFFRNGQDTTQATTQADIFSPSGGGPPENTQCRGTNYGKTTWYDFYPDRDGTVRLRSSGYDNVIALYTFNRATLLPDDRFRCVHTSSSPSEELDATVKAGKSYTIQIGGVVDPATGIAASGTLQFLFDFFPKPPHRLTANSTLKASATSSGIQVLGLSVSTARAAKVTVSCGHFCHKQSKKGKTTESFPKLKSTTLPAGSALTIRVTAPHSIGAFIQYNVVRGNFTKLTRCTEPGSRKPKKTCH
jgi:hypothetical protein